MADIRKPEFARYRGSTCVSREEQPEAAAQTWEDKAFTFINATGQFEEISTTPASVTAIWGLTANAATGITDNPTNDEPVTVDLELLMCISHSGDENLAVTAQTLVGGQFELRRILDPLGNETWTIDINGTTDPAVQIQKLAPEFPVGEQHGLVYAKVLKSFLQYQP